MEQPPIQHPKTTMAIHRKQPRAMCQPLALLFTIKELIVQYKGRWPINQQAPLFIVICKYFLIHSRYNCHRQGVAEVKLSPNGINLPFNWSVCPVIISSQIHCCANTIWTHQERESNWGEICPNLCASVLCWLMFRGMGRTSGHRRRELTRRQVHAMVKFNLRRVLRSNLMRRSAIN